MSRNKKTNTADDLLEIVAVFPWWAGVLLAALSYWVLHGVASQPTLTPVSPGQMGAMVTQTLWWYLASIGQYLLPFICLLGAATSAWRRYQRKTLFADVSSSNALQTLDGISWREFEMLVGEGFRTQGYQVEETGVGGADGGVDLVLTRPGKNGREKFLVQCKQWRAFKVSVNVVRELYGVMAAQGATGGFVVTSGRFTSEAVNFASGRNVTLVDGTKLHEFLLQARVKTEISNSLKPTAHAEKSAVLASQAMTCPLCAKPMVRRTAKRGFNTGHEFWGCAGYPSCRGTHPIN